MNNTRRGNLIVVSGASGVGKSTVIAKLLEKQESIYFSVSWTTRGPRPGEENGINYHFTDKETFETMIGDAAFLEHAQYVGNYYGTAKVQVEEARNAGRDVLLDIEVQGAAQVKANCPDAILVFIMPPSFAELERRLRDRGTDTEEKIAGRLKRAREEFADIHLYDYLVVNDRVEDAAAELSAILMAEQCRVSNRMDRMKEV